ncbi:MAG: hypothetical protein RBS17_08025 [Coriobacteriia bacterium]|nr:hypothetical protein [Coriobacteriia bacterium]
MDKFTEDICTCLTGAVQDATEHMATLEVLLDRAERTIDILAEWYCKDVHPPGFSRETVAQVAYSRAIREQEAGL